MIESLVVVGSGGAFPCTAPGSPTHGRLILASGYSNEDAFSVITAFFLRVGSLHVCYLGWYKYIASSAQDSRRRENAASEAKVIMAYATSSRTTLGRESVFPLPPSATSLDFLANLEECFQVTRECVDNLQRSVDRLYPGTKDLARLTKVLEHKHRYLVLPQPTVQAHKSALASSLAPQIDQLINRAESAVESEKARVTRLEERLSILQAAQLPPEPVAPSRSAQQHLGVGVGVSEIGEGEDGEGSGSALDGLSMADMSAAQRRKVIMLRGKRQRLEKERRRLMGEEE